MTPNRVEDHLFMQALEPAQHVRLAENLAIGAAKLDRLVQLIASHRQTGCQLPFCGSAEFATTISQYGPEQLHIILRLAIERLAAASS